MQPTVVFVDGPTGVGKDYFINQLSGLYSQTYPEQGIKIIRAADIILSKDQTASEERKYTTYQTDKDKSAAIFEGHIELLQIISDSLQTPYTPGLTVINRGFLSFLQYNVYSQPWSMREQYIERYSKHLPDILRKSRNVSVVIRPDIRAMPMTDIVSGIECIIERLRSRGDDKPIDEEWLKDLYQRYERIPVAYSKIFHRNFTMHSGQAQEFLSQIHQSGESTTPA